MFAKQTAEAILAHHPEITLHKRVELRERVRTPRRATSSVFPWLTKIYPVNVLRVWANWKGNAQT